MTLPAPDQLKAALEGRLSGVTVTVDGLPAPPQNVGGAQAGAALLVEPKDLAAVCRALKADPQWQCDYLSNLTAVDYLPAPPQNVGGAQAGRIDVVYHLYSMALKHGPVTLRVKLPRANPVVASVTPIWRGAEFQEREVFDLFGVRFEGHPDLRRILMWDGFDGHPMRKDYIVEDQDALEERPR